MTDFVNTLYDRIVVSVWILRVSAKHIVNGSSIVETRGHPAIGVITGFTTRVSQAFHFIPYRAMRHTEIWIGVAGGRIVSQTHFVKSCLEPVLEVKLFVCPAGAMYKLAATNRLVTLEKHVYNRVVHTSVSHHVAYVSRR
jgi:hypothetical protein